MNKSSALELLGKANFDWTQSLQSVWRDNEYHVEGYQSDAMSVFKQELDELINNPSTDTQLGLPFVGSGGVGKTHLLGRFRAYTAAQDSVFIMVDMTDVRDFWETVLAGYTTSLQEITAKGEPQRYFVLLKIIEHFSNSGSHQEKLKLGLANCHRADKSQVKSALSEVLGVFHARYRREVSKYQDVIRAFIIADSRDFEIANAGGSWLQGLEIEEEDKKAFGFTRSSQRPSEIVAALSWLISLGSPAVVAFDQLDPIIRQLEFQNHVDDGEITQDQDNEAFKIITGIGSGLSAIFDVTRRSVFVLSCLENSWSSVTDRMLVPEQDRFRKATVLKSLSSGEIVRSLVAARMQKAADDLSLSLPYSSWPYSEEKLSLCVGHSPREILKRCDTLRRDWLAGKERLPPGGGKGKGREKPQGTTTLDERFASYQKEVNPHLLLDETNEDGDLAEGIQSLGRVLLRELPPLDDIGVIVDTDFTGGSKTKPLHIRLRLVFYKEDEREEHFSVRVLQKQNARAFQNRLKLAMTNAGISKALGFRKLVLLRNSSVPTGEVSSRMSDNFMAEGGRFAALTEHEARVIYALHRLLQDNDPDLDLWLEKHKPASSLDFSKIAFSGLLNRYSSTVAESETTKGKQQLPPFVPRLRPVGNAETVPPLITDTPSKPANPPKRPDAAIESDDQFSLGVGSDGQKVTMPVELLEKHTVVLAGAGSGKTVLLKRIVENAALMGIPSIVLDGANDMAGLSEQWPSPPAGWDDSDAGLAERFHREVDTVIWTPGRQGGNPLRLELLPDLSGVKGDPDEFDASVSMVGGGLADALKLGSSKADQNKRGILVKSLKHYVLSNGRGLSGFIALLTDLPAAALLGIEKEQKLAVELADGLRVMTETDPMLAGDGTSLDPAILFGDDTSNSSTRVSVVSLNFLATQELQQRFVGQLSTTLFAWVKQNPTPPNGRKLRGLLVIDEAKDFIPGMRSTACKESLMRLTAQARKYHLGIVFATQNPREIENTIVGNCSTQFYGKANSPAAIGTIKQRLQDVGGNGADIGRLTKGIFYIYNADVMAGPQKLQTPLCLTHHRTMNGEEVLEKAKCSVGVLQVSKAA